MAFWKQFEKTTVLEFSWVPALLYFFLKNNNMSVFSVLAPIILAQCIISYSISAYKWHSVNRFQTISDDANVLPPQYPSLIPYVGNALSFAWDNANFLWKSTCYDSRLISSRISFLGFEIYAFQDRKTIANIWKQPTLSSPISMFVYVFKYFFGLSDRVISIYRADDSGPFPKPYKGSNIPPQNRVDHITSHGFLRYLGGPGLLPTTRRYMNALSVKMNDKDFTEEWTNIEDFSTFFQDVVGSSLVESLYGPAMLRLNPDFMKDLWSFDGSVPWLARGVPSFLKPSAYRPREGCVAQIKRWYAYARKHFDESLVAPDGDGDPCWGSGLMRYRQSKLVSVPNHDDDAIARMDLGFAWGAVGNTIPCAMLSAFHIFKDPSLLQRVRDDVEHSFGSLHLPDIDPSLVIKEHLLSSIYAEVLRLYVKTYFMVSSPHADVSLGKWKLPQGSIGLMNAGISHMDEGFWNAYGGEHPVNSFWADRFIVDPTDTQSGPVAPHVRDFEEWLESKRESDKDGCRSTRPFFSMDGTEGSWFPYGGGHSICPGRFLAKGVILSTCIFLARDYDVEILSEKVEMSAWRFGLGVGGLKHALPFRIRKRCK